MSLPARLLRNRFSMPTSRIGPPTTPVTVSPVVPSVRSMALPAAVPSKVAVSEPEGSPAWISMPQRAVGQPAVDGELVIAIKSVERQGLHGRDRDIDVVAVEAQQIDRAGRVDREAIVAAGALIDQPIADECAPPSTVIAGAARPRPW